MQVDHETFWPVFAFSHAGPPRSAWWMGLSVSKKGGPETMDAVLLDLKYGIRSLWRDKGFALTVLLTFSVCIAANTALFAIVHSVILRPLPVPDSGSILLMSNDYPKAGASPGNNSSPGDYYD